MAKPSIYSIGTVRRRAVRLSQQEDLVRTEVLENGKLLPLVLKPNLEGVNLISWVKSHRELIEEQVLIHGGILFRGFAIRKLGDFEELVAALSGELLDYTYRSTPRSQEAGKIYTSTEFPANQTIPLHNEMAYARSWPLKIWFFSLKVAADGGETPIADSREVYRHIDPNIREQFTDRKVMYVRNYGGGVDLPWTDVFQTNSRSDVEAFCRRSGIELDWGDGDRLRTRQVCQAVIQHPKTGEMSWFNQAHLFHISSLDSTVRQSLIEAFSEDGLPRNAYFGDGSPIEVEMLEQIREVYRRLEVVFQWQTGDMLLLDNVLAAHGRRPYSGKRKVVVGMAEPMQAGEIEGHG